MFLIRSAAPGDLDALERIARHLDTVNLPNDRDRLAAILGRSAAAFSGKAAMADREFVFVLEKHDEGGSELLGCSMLFAQHGTRKAPHVYFDVLEEERYSDTVDRLFAHKVLRIGFNYKGVTEVGGLVLLPQYRGHPLQLGKLLSYVRFVFVARMRTWFRDDMLAELLPPLQPDGRSLLWEALGRRFTDMDYQEADRLSRENKEFIKALFPQAPIYACLLSPEARALIGEVGPATKGVEHMLRKIGFRYAGRIDPFDGGPHFHARTDEVALVRDTVMRRLAPAGKARLHTDALVAHVAPDGNLRAARARVALDSETVQLDGETTAALQVTTDSEVSVLRL